MKLVRDCSTLCRATKLMGAFILALGLTAATARAADDSVVQHPHFGPYTQQIASVAAWNVQPGYLSLDSDDTTRLMESMQNPGVVEAWLYAPKGLDRWFSVIRYGQTGHVSDDEKIDAAAVLEQLKRATEVGNEERRKRGWNEFHIIGWQVEPHYEPDTKRLSWATLGESGGQQVINYTTKILSREGVATVTLVTAPASLDASIAELKAQLDNFEFHPDQQYAAFRSGDKIAEYGLTGLIVGGAAAVAVKAGAWKWIVGMLAVGWKFIAAAVVAALAGIKSLFKRRTT